jgi:hypothetical protein
MFRSITYLVKLVKAASPNLYFDDSPKELQAGSVHTAEEKDGDVSRSDLKYCCISIMHYSLRHASFTKTNISVGNGSSVRRIWRGSIGHSLSTLAVSQVNRSWNISQPITNAQWIQVLPNSCKFKQCSTTLLISHLMILTAHQQPWPDP